MHDRASYPNAKTGTAALAQPIHDPLGLLPEHLNAIAYEWNSHLIKQKISGNYLRILNAIYHQTIDFNKWEDDLAGKRLQQLTHIRYDHSNFIVKKLFEKNIILKRKGNYGSIVSINFNFSTWGKPRKNTEPNHANNDPTQLLAEEIRNNPIDNGVDLGLSDDFTVNPVAAKPEPQIETKPVITEKIIISEPESQIEKKPDSTKKFMISESEIKAIVEEQIAENSLISKPESEATSDELTMQQMEAQFEELRQRKQFTEQKLAELAIKEKANDQELLRLKEQEEIAEARYKQALELEASYQSKELLSKQEPAPPIEAQVLEQEENLPTEAEFLRESMENEIVQCYIEEQQQLHDRIDQLESKLTNNQDIEQQWQAQNQHVQKIENQQTQQSKKITELEIALEQQKQAEQAAQQQAAQQQKIAEQYAQKEAEYYAEKQLENLSISIPSPEDYIVAMPLVNNVDSSIDNQYDDSEDNYKNAPNASFELPQNLQFLNFADNISSELQSKLVNLLLEAGQDAQKLLDIFSAQLSNKNDLDSVLSPTARFAQLLHRLQIGELNIEDTETLITRAKGEQTPYLLEFERLETIQQAAYSEQQRYLTIYKEAAEEQSLSMEDYLETQSKTEFWQRLCDELRQSEYALRDLMVARTAITNTTTSNHQIAPHHHAKVLD